MTAINLFLKAGAAYIVADSAGYEPDGTILAIASKVAVADRLSMALICSGRANPVQISELLALYGTATQEDALRAIPLAMRDIREDNRLRAPDGELSGDNEMQVFVAMYSHERQRAETLYCTTTAEYDGGTLEPYVVRPVARVSTPFSDLPFDDPERDGLAILEAQRRIPWPDGGYFVGGFGELVTVTRDGIDKRKIVEWPDRVGEKICDV